MRELQPAGINPPFARYAHGVEVNPARKLVVTSGQLGVDRDGRCPQSVEDQAKLCFRNIDAILAEAGMSVENVIRLNAFVTDRTHMQGYMAARDRWLGAVTRLPASTLIVVAGFTRPEFKVEIEATAAAE